MSLTSHLSSLELKHQTLEREIEVELSRPNADAVRLSELKRKKLKVKEQITRLKTNSSGDTLH
jgi:hypothetical protein